MSTRPGKVRNPNAFTKFFGFGRGERGLNFGSTSTESIPGSYDALLGALAHANGGGLQLKRMPQPFEYDQPADRVPYRIVTLGTIADDDHVTIGGVKFEFDVSADGVTAGAIAVLGANAAAAIENLQTAINANSTVAALGIVARDFVSISTNSAYLVLAAPGLTTFPSATITDTGATRVVTSAAVNPVAQEPLRFDVLSAAIPDPAAAVTVVTGFTSIEAVFPRFATSAGAEKATNAPITVSGGTIHIALGTNVATTPVAVAALVATDIVTLLVLGR